jgi:preprotein translocase subunit SecD
MNHAPANTGGTAVISGSFTLQEARELAAILESAVDLRIRVVEERKI